MKALKFFFLGRPGVAGLARWKFHLRILITLMSAKSAADGLATAGRVMALKGHHVPGFVAAAGPFSEIVFWPAAFLFLYLVAAVVPHCLKSKAGGQALQS